MPSLSGEAARAPDHGDWVALPRASFVPPAHGERPPRLNLSASDKTRRRRFVVPSRVHLPPVPGQDSRNAALVAGGVLPPWQSQGSVSTATAATKTGCHRRPTPPPGTPGAVLQRFHPATRMTGCRCWTGPQPRHRRRQTLPLRLSPGTLLLFASQDDTA
jgi:hypothetical protein